MINVAIWVPLKETGKHMFRDIQLQALPHIGESIILDCPKLRIVEVVHKFTLIIIKTESIGLGSALLTEFDKNVWFEFGDK